MLWMDSAHADGSVKVVVNAPRSDDMMLSLGRMIYNMKSSKCQEVVVYSEVGQKGREKLFARRG